MSINIDSDNTMRDLKEKAKSNKDKGNKYVIPRGGLYNWVS
jgi:hypothetical protein